MMFGHAVGTLADMGSFIIGALAVLSLVIADAADAAVSVPWADLGAIGLPALVTGIAIGVVSGTRRRSTT